jgi:hypothetical protein
VTRRSGDGGEGSGGESSGAGSLRARNWGKEERWEEGMSGAPFIGLEGGAGWPGDGGEQVAAVVCHDCGGGGRFRRGSAGAVVGSDEGVLWPFQERKGGGGWEAARTCAH